METELAKLKKWYDGITPSWINMVRDMMITLDQIMSDASLRPDAEYVLPPWLNDMREEVAELKDYVVKYRAWSSEAIPLYEEKTRKKAG